MDEGDYARIQDEHQVYDVEWTYPSWKWKVMKVMNGGELPNVLFAFQYTFQILPVCTRKKPSIWQFAFIRDLCYLLFLVGCWVHTVPSNSGGQHSGMVTVANFDMRPIHGHCPARERLIWQFDISAETDIAIQELGAYFVHGIGKRELVSFAQSAICICIRAQRSSPTWSSNFYLYPNWTLNGHPVHFFYRITRELYIIYLYKKKDINPKSTFDILI